MAAALPLDTSSNSNDEAAQHHAQHQQDSTSPALALRFPSNHIDPISHDAKTGGYSQPRRGLAQVFTSERPTYNTTQHHHREKPRKLAQNSSFSPNTNLTNCTDAYHDILHTWMGLHRAFSKPAAACRRRPQLHYDTFTYNSADYDACCDTTTSANAFAAAVGDMILEPYINGLLICVPLGVSSYWAAAPSIVVFAVNALAIVPLSSLLTDATERIALEAGDAVGAFLNISLGNIVELILL